MYLSAKRAFMVGILAIIGLFGLCIQSHAQRLQQDLGRGVVAVQNGSSVTVTWRRLAQEPEQCTWNIYVKKAGGATFSKINSTPITLTNYKTTTSIVPTGAEIAVAMVTTTDGKETEGDLSTAFKFTAHSPRNVFMEIPFQGGPLNNASYTTKFCWPVDIDGNGEYDYVVNRNCTDGTGNSCIEAYLADGTYLWTVDLGPNELSCAGQDDQICAYDIDCDGYGEVICQTSDGTRFWDKQNNTWGLYVNGNTTGDTDGDGIIDYETQNVRNAPRYFTVINGMTGAEKASVEQRYDEAYNRTNRATLMGDEYNRHTGHVGVFYHDGKHPAVVMEWHTRRSSDKGHQYRNSAFAYDFDASGRASNWHQLFMENVGGAEFHMIRVFDADGDGKDEMSSGAYCMDHDGSTLYNTGISHGDRHRTSDIDPERPGLETFSIQQNAPDMLGQILFDAGTGEAIKKWYLPAVGDVGRGECMDLDPTHLGWEMFSTMDSYQMYDAKGDKIEGKYGYFPTEGLWWDGDLGRERVDTPDGNGENTMIVDYNNGRLYEMAKESGWTVKSIFGKRALYWGDIIGDWREEVVLKRVKDGVNTGIVGFTTDITTDVNNIYCLQQDPHYRTDCTTRGYYQTPNPGFYLGYNMPRPQLPPCMKADAKNQVFDLSLGNTTVTPQQGMDNIYLMPVKNQTLTINTDISGKTTLWKSQQGTVILKGKHTRTSYSTQASSASVQGGSATAQGTSAAAIISEGTLQVDGTIAGTVDLRARGTLSGSGVVDSIMVEGALNYEGGRIMPQGTLTVNKSLNLNKKTFIELDINHGDCVKTNGDLTITAPVVFTIASASKAEGEYKLLEYGGNYAGSSAKFSARGLTGLSYNIINKERAIYLIINGQRQSAKNVTWTGTNSGTWDYQSQNWTLSGESTSFVASDSIVFNDDAKVKTITIAELMPIGTMEVNNNTAFTFNSTDGGMTGSGSLIKNGTGTLTLNAVKSDYTGPTIINSGTVVVKELADAGIASSIGAASADASNLKIGKATLTINNTNSATNRGITLTDTATVNITSGTASLKGRIIGSGILQKTGAGQVNITYSGTNGWAGTILQSGTLAMGAWNTTFGTALSPIHVTGSSTIVMFDSNNTSALPNVQNAITIDAGKTLTFKAGSRCTVKGSLAGKGTIKVSFPYVRGDVYTNVAAFEGTYDVMPPLNDEKTNNCRFIQAMDFSKATLKIESGANVGCYKAGSGTSQSLTNKVGSLTGSGTLLNSIWNVGYLNNNDTFSGVFAEGTTLNKYGTGNMTLSGASAGALNIYNGTVTLYNKTAAVTTGTITVNSGGTLLGKQNNFCGSVNVKSGGKLQLNASNALCYNLNVGGTLTMASGSTLEVLAVTSASSATKCDYIEGEGNVKMTNPAISIRKTTSYSYKAGDELQIFRNTGTMSLSGTTTITPAVPEYGFVWDTSKFSTEGKLGILLAGDLNGDGKVTLEEANRLANILLTIAPETASVSLSDFANNSATEGINPYSADIDGNGIINMSDAKGIADLYICKKN